MLHTMTDNERLQEIRQLVRRNGCDGVCVYGTALTVASSFLLLQLEQRDKTIAELSGIYEAQFGAYNHLLQRQNTLMLSALERISAAEIPPSGSCDSWAIDIARDTIAQVKVNTASKEGV